MRPIIRKPTVITLYLVRFSQVFFVESTKARCFNIIYRLHERELLFLFEKNRDGKNRYLLQRLFSWKNSWNTIIKNRRTHSVLNKTMGQNKWQKVYVNKRKASHKRIIITITSSSCIPRTLDASPRWFESFERRNAVERWKDKQLARRSCSGGVENYTAITTRKGVSYNGRNIKEEPSGQQAYGIISAMHAVSRVKILSYCVRFMPICVNIVTVYQIGYIIVLVNN